MNTRSATACLILLTFAATGCEVLDVFEREEAIAVDALPPAVRSGAEAALPGLVVRAAEREREGAAWEYEIEGTHDGRPVEISLTESGRVLEIEYEDGDD